MAASTYCEQAILNAIFGKTSSFGALASRPTLYIALCTSTPVPGDTGSTITECNYTNYARVQTAASDWTTASGSNPAQVSNATVITFPAATGGTSVATAFAIVDAASAGNVIFSGTLSAPLAISNLIAPYYAIGAMVQQAQ